MAKKKSENPNFIFRRSWGRRFDTIVDKYGYDALGRVLIGIYKTFSGEEVPELNLYCESLLDTLVDDITEEQEAYKQSCSNKVNGAKATNAIKHAKVANATNATENANDAKATNTSQVNTSQVNTSQVNISTNVDKGVIGEKRKRFVPPTLEEINNYCLEAGISLDAEKFHSYYESNGWKVGRNPMKDWKAACRNWARRDEEVKKPEPKSIWDDDDDLFDGLEDLL